LGHEERFPPPGLSAGCGFRKETVAGLRRNGRVAPITAVPAIAAIPSRQNEGGGAPIPLITFKTSLVAPEFAGAARVVPPCCCVTMSQLIESPSPVPSPVGLVVKNG